METKLASRECIRLGVEGVYGTSISPPARGWLQSERFEAAAPIESAARAPNRLV